MRTRLCSVAAVLALLVPVSPARAATEACFGKEPTIVGTDGNDELRGTYGPDVIQGLGGTDDITGLSGADLICGDEGNDFLQGGTGRDKVSGGKGEDVLSPGDGADLLRGGEGGDRLMPSWGSDQTIDGGPGHDLVVLTSFPKRLRIDLERGFARGGPAGMSSGGWSPRTAVPATT